MTQVKCRTAGGKGMSQAAWKYLMRKEVAYENLKKRQEQRDAAAKAEIRSKITLPKLKFMGQK